MGATTGIVPIGVYDTGTLAAKIAAFLALIPDPDAAHGTGSVAGSGQTPRVGAGFLDEMSPGAAAALRAELESLSDNLVGSGYDDVAFGVHVATGAEATANQMDIVTGLGDTAVTEIAVTISRAGSIIQSDQVVTEPSAGTIRVADGSTYSVTAADRVVWFARKVTA